MKQNKYLLQLLDWTEQEYSQCMYDTGVRYLHEYIPDDEEAIASLERSRIFWNWWRNHWRQRDEMFIARVNPYAPAAGIRKYYYFYNDAAKLVHSMWPNAVVLHESYARMIGEFNDEVKIKN